MKHCIVYRRDDRYAAFPHITFTAGGTLLVVFREAGEASARAALAGTHTHVDPDSRILLTASGDGGETWSAPVVVYQGEFAVNDSALTVLRDGRWLVRFARWRLAPSAQRRRLGGPVMRHFVREGRVGTMAGNGFVQSLDGGKTWSPLRGIVAAPALVRAVSREAVIELPDGTLLLPVYDGYPFHTECAWLLRSWDGGATWEDESFVAGEVDPPRPYRQALNYNETAMLALDALTLLAVIRVDGGFVTDDGTFVSEGGLGELAWTISYDAGLTWAQPRPTGLWGQPAHLLCLADGRLLCTYGYRRPPYGVRAALFTIEGETWHTLAHVVLRDDGVSWDLGYPASAELPGGEIYSCYYFHGPDGVRHIAGTRWDVSEMAPWRGGDPT